MDIAFNKFEEIKHLPLQVFNRVVFLNNLLSDAGHVIAKKYVESFTDVERKQMFIMQAYIKSKGIEQTKKDVTKNLVVDYDAAE